jgi:hypothetical protein
MVSAVAISSMGLAMAEAILTLKFSTYPGVTTEYAASIVGYNAIATVTLVSALTPLFDVFTTPIALYLAVLCVLGISAVAVDGLIPDTGNKVVDSGIDLMVKAGMMFAIYSVPLLAFPTYVAPILQL